jgi:enoyl-[acyl-carrier protein] reductase / trans-2-enoyl-CoA reductase (NAD+)
VTHDDANGSLPVFPKLPLGGIDRRGLVSTLATQGQTTAEADLAAARALVKSSGLALPKEHAVLLLGGSGGILRALAIQLLFGEKVAVYAVHYDSEKLQIGGFHARAMETAAAEAGVSCRFFNRDAVKPETIAEVVAEIKKHHQVVHLVNGIAAGATKRFVENGPAQVRDLDVAFHPVRQVADFSSFENLRQFGLVNVETATPADIERTYKFMGHSTTPWVEALAAEGLLAKGESLVSFADYEYEADDPVYAMGPLAQAKVLQREAMNDVQSRFGVRCVRLRYPAMNTTAIGAIPGGLLMFAGTAQVLLVEGKYRNLSMLARDTMPVFALDYREAAAELDADYQRCLPRFHELKRSLTPDRAVLREKLDRVFGYEQL